MKSANMLALLAAANSFFFMLILFVICLSNQIDGNVMIALGLLVIFSTSALAILYVSIFNLGRTKRLRKDMVDYANIIDFNSKLVNKISGGR